MDKESKRSKNFTQEETDLLIDLVNQKKGILECKKSGAVSFKQKNNAWIEISKHFNTMMGGEFRSDRILKEKWNNLKRNSTKTISRIKRQSSGTGGGPPINESLTALEKKVCEILGDRISGMVSTCDSDTLQVNMPNDDQIEKVADEVDLQNAKIVILDDVQHGSTTSEHISFCTGIELFEQDEIEKNISNPGSSRNWGDFTPSLLKTPVSKPLLSNNNIKSKKKVTNTIVNEKWSRLAEKKDELVDQQKQMMTEQHLEELALKRLTQKILQDEHTLKMKHIEEEHALKLMQMTEEHALKIEILKKQLQ